MANQKELRHLTATELRAAGAGGDDLKIEGYAAKFNQESNDLGGFRELIAPGAFARTLRQRDPNDPDYDGDDDNDVKCLADHDGTRLLGRTANKSLQLSCDATGLRFRCKLNPKLQTHRDLHEAVKTGLMSTCSFAFRCGKDGQRWEDRANGTTLRTLTDVDLFDVSVLGVAPAYPNTEVDARAAMDQRVKRPYTQAEIKAIKDKLQIKLNSKIALAENSLVDTGDIAEVGETVTRALAGAQYVADEERAARVAKVLDEFKHEAVVKWLRGITPIGSGK